MSKRTRQRLARAEESRLYELAAEVWGETPQLLKTIEELSELQRAISRYLIIKSDENIGKEADHWNLDLQIMAIYSEIVDVEIMIAQVKEVLNRPAIYAHARDVKLQNLRRLLRLEEVDEL